MPRTRSRRAGARRKTRKTRRSGCPCKCSACGCGARGRRTSTCRCKKCCCATRRGGARRSRSRRSRSRRSRSRRGHPMRGGGYYQYMSNTPYSAGMQMPADAPYLKGGDTALANHVTYDRTMNCGDNYNHYTGNNSPSV